MPARTLRHQRDRDAAAGGSKGLLHVDDDMRLRVERWRRQRMSWAAIARNLGRSEPDVRREFDQSRLGAPSSPAHPQSKGAHP